MKNTFASILIVIVLALVVSLAVPAAASLVKPNKSATNEGRWDQITGVNITPINVESNGTLTATGYVQGECVNCTPPGLQPAVGAEVHFDRVDSDGWWPQASGTTDSNGYFSLTCQAPSGAGPYMYGIFVPAKGIEGGTQIGPWIVTVY